jgi:hypothetical protein
LSNASIERHRRNGHIPPSLLKARSAQEVASADALLSDIEDLQCKTLRILDKAEAASDLRTALTAVREVRGNMELLAKLAQLIQEGTTINVVNNPQWIAVEAVVIEALAPYPQARAAVVEALEATP